jgi:hypothetical protein
LHPVFFLDMTKFISLHQFRKNKLLTKIDIEHVDGELS